MLKYFAEEASANKRNALAPSRGPFLRSSHDTREKARLALSNARAESPHHCTGKRDEGIRDVHDVGDGEIVGHVPTPQRRRSIVFLVGLLGADLVVNALPLLLARESTLRVTPAVRRYTGRGVQRVDGGDRVGGGDGGGGGGGSAGEGVDPPPRHVGRRLQRLEVRSSLARLLPPPPPRGSLVALALVRHLAAPLEPVVVGPLLLLRLTPGQGTLRVEVQPVF